MAKTGEAGFLTRVDTREMSMNTITERRVVNSAVRA